MGSLSVPCTVLPAVPVGRCSPPRVRGGGGAQSASLRLRRARQAHFERCPMPISDYVTDTRSILDQAGRVLNAMLEIAAGMGLLGTTLKLLKLYQMVVQVRELRAVVEPGRGGDRVQSCCTLRGGGALGS